MKKVILIFTLISCMFINSFGQETPLNLVLKARILVRDSVHLVEKPKNLIRETKSLIKEVQGLTKKQKFKNNKHTNYQIGLTYQPFFFKNYESQNGEQGSILIKPEKFNGFALGLTFRKALNKHISLKSEITYSKQSEIFSSSNYTTSNGNGENKRYIYNGEEEFEYSITKIPLLIDYKLNLGLSNWSIHGYTGLQLAYLNSYTITYLVYQVNHDAKRTLNRDVLEIIAFEKNGKGYGKYLSPTSPDADADGYVEYATLDEAKNYLFRTWSVGVVGGFEIEKVINSKYTIGFGLRYQYNLTKSESHEEDAFYLPNSSHRKRIGMTLSISRLIH